VLRQAAVHLERARADCPVPLALAFPSPAVADPGALAVLDRARVAGPVASVVDGVVQHVGGWEVAGGLTVNLHGTFNACNLTGFIFQNNLLAMIFLHFFLASLGMMKVAYQLVSNFSFLSYFVVMLFSRSRLEIGVSAPNSPLSKSQTSIAPVVACFCKQMGRFSLPVACPRDIRGHLALGDRTGFLLFPPSVLAPFVAVWLGPEFRDFQKHTNFLL